MSAIKQAPDFFKFAYEMRASLTLWSLVFIVALILIINVDLIRIGLFGKLSQLTPRRVTPAQAQEENMTVVSLFSLEDLVKGTHILNSIKQRE